MKLEDLNIKIFADCSDLKTVLELACVSHISGFTTNPTLMRKAGVKEYEAWAKAMIAGAVGLPISFEVLADDFDEMERQARKIASWGESVYVKIPITDTKGKSAAGVIQRLSKDSIKVNVTAVMTEAQLYAASIALRDGARAIISIFAGRIADSGRNPEDLMERAFARLIDVSNVALLWASTREIYNVVQANNCGCHVITLSPDLIDKLHLLGKDLTEFSRETVQQFYDDAQVAGYTL